MAMFAWIMMGLAIWHFTIWVPDRFWGGIVGAFIAAIIGSVITGLAFNGFGIPSQDDTTILSAIEAIPGCLIAMGVCYLVGARKGNEPAIA
jgi:uncharacterized membrane protein YeaQ/YmgE (transglycosylase-associated protein family)